MEKRDSSWRGLPSAEMFGGNCLPVNVINSHHIFGIGVENVERIRARGCDKNRTAGLTNSVPTSWRRSNLASRRGSILASA